MEQYTEIQKDLEIILDLFQDIEFSDLCKKLDIAEERFTALLDGSEPTKQELENIYNFAYNRGLYLNEITWQECLDEFRNETINIGTHGSRNVIKGDIRLDVSGESNDFGSGFYVGEDISQAGMFVCEEPNASLYILTFDTDNLKRYQFNVSIDWMLAICYFRERIGEYANHPRIQSIRERVAECDYVVAPIADNKIFELLDAFAAGELTDLQCLYALSATHLGYQYVMKTQEALNHLNIIKHLYYCATEKSLYNKEADVETNTSINKALIAKKRYSNQGKYINELLSEDNFNESYNESEYIKNALTNGMEVKEYKGLSLLKWPNQRDVTVIDPITDAHCGIYKSQKEARDVIDGKIKHLGKILPAGHNGLKEELKLRTDYEPVTYEGTYYIDSWWDKHSKSYITQVKDEEGNEVDCQYSGNKNDRDFDIKEFKQLYNINEEKKKKKEPELLPTGLSPIIPDKGKGIDTFNKNMGVSSETSTTSSSGAEGASGE